MYFPYLRGRQYELLALSELISKDKLSGHVIPVVEPVRLSPTLIKMMQQAADSKYPLALIRNPQVGEFLEELKTKPENLSTGFNQLYGHKSLIKALIINETAEPFLKEEKHKDNLLVVLNNRDNLDLYNQYFQTTSPRYTLVSEKAGIQRKITKNRVLLGDRFTKLQRNADYEDKDEFFSEEHLYWEEDPHNAGFGDYSIIGDDYGNGGFAPYAVAIHLVYLTKDKELRLKHFVSDSNEDISNPALKFYEAVSKLAKWVEENISPEDYTEGLKGFLDHYNNKSYPGLGTVKKLSLMHHLELMDRYLKEV